MAKRKPNKALLQKYKVSPALANIIGPSPVSRGELMKKIWAYIKRKGLQDPKNRRNIKADEKLKHIFGKKKVVSMFEMTKLLNQHLGDAVGAGSSKSSKKAGKKVSKKRNPGYSDYEYDEDEDDDNEYEIYSNPEDDYDFEEDDEEEDDEEEDDEEEEDEDEDEDDY